MKIENLNWLKIGQRGVLNLDIPVYSIGSGSPSLAITCSVHGDETGGLFIVSRMLEAINNIEELTGTIHIIPAANPVAQFMNSRVAFLDHKDLNRVGNGRHDGSYTERVANELFNFLSKCDAVINIHEFEMKTPVTAIIDNVGSEEVKKGIINLIRVFNPEIIWSLNLSQASDTQYQNTLDLSLTRAGVINFPIETSQLVFLTEAEIERASHGLLNVAEYMGILKIEQENIESECHTLTRNEVTVETAGLWEPDSWVDLKQEIKKDDLIGTLKTLPDFKEQKIYSPYSGYLMQYRHRQLVSTGTAIFSIGIDCK